MRKDKFILVQRTGNKCKHTLGSAFEARNTFDQLPRYSATNLRNNQSMLNAQRVALVLQLGHAYGNRRVQRVASDAPVESGEVEMKAVSFEFSSLRQAYWEMRRTSPPRLITQFHKEVDNRFWELSQYKVGEHLNPRLSEDKPYISIWWKVCDDVMSEWLMRSADLGTKQEENKSQNEPVKEPTVESTELNNYVEKYHLDTEFIEELVKAAKGVSHAIHILEILGTKVPQLLSKAATVVLFAELFWFPIEVLIEIGKASRTDLAFACEKATAYATTAWIFNDPIIWEIPEFDLEGEPGRGGGLNNWIRGRETGGIDEVKNEWRTCTYKTITELETYCKDELGIPKDVYRTFVQAQAKGNKSAMAKSIFDKLGEHYSSAISEAREVLLRRGYPN